MNISKALSTLSAPDYGLMRRVNRWQTPRWVRWWMIAATRRGDGWFWAFCGIAVLAAHDATSYAACIAAALASAAGIVLFQTLKKLVGRPRPCAFEPHCWATLLPPDQFSFPSGHSITAFAVAISLGQFFPAAYPVWLFFAVSVAASRVMLGMHFLSDVLAGSLLGAGLGCCAAWLVS